MRLRALLTRGYFPKELPRPFVTASFAKCVTASPVLPGDFAKTATKGAKLRSAQTAIYSLARGGLLRRPLSICNPIHYFLLCNEISQNWASIKPRVAGAALSATAPEFKTKADERAIDGKFGQGARSELAQNTRLGRRYILQTDINRFYHSIYTHSIAWALHGKATAKANKTLALLGNKIDYWIRMGQDQQTVGIPIGPDTSLLMAELIMQRCDETLLAELPRVKGHRFIDDYELSFQTRTEAEEAFHILDACLSGFELALNPKKTQVLELPLPLEFSWATELKQFPFSRNSRQGQAADLNNYFSKAFELHSSKQSNEISNNVVFPSQFARLLIEYQEHPEAKSLAPDDSPCDGNTRGLLQRAHIIAGDLRYVGKETDRKWEEGDDISIVEFNTTEYGRSTKVIATDEIKAKILEIGINKCARQSGFDRKNFIRKLTRGIPVKRNSYQEFVRWMQSYESAEMRTKSGVNE